MNLLTKNDTYNPTMILTNALYLLVQEENRIMRDESGQQFLDMYNENERAIRYVNNAISYIRNKCYDISEYGNPEQDLTKEQLRLKFLSFNSQAFQVNGYGGYGYAGSWLIKEKKMIDLLPEALRYKIIPL